MLHSTYHLLYLYESLFIYLFIYLFITVEILRLDYLKNGQYNHLQIFLSIFRLIWNREPPLFSLITQP